jgi:hypothetical protein
MSYVRVQNPISEGIDVQRFNRFLTLYVIMKMPLEAL